MRQRDSILIIEDDPAVGESLRDSLRDSMFRVEWKSSGAEGVAWARESGPDLVILDVRLPDGSGFDFCRQMRQMRLSQPILMLTARRQAGLCTQHLLARCGIQMRLSSVTKGQEDELRKSARLQNEGR